MIGNVSERTDTIFVGSSNRPMNKFQKKWQDDYFWKLESTKTITAPELHACISCSGRENRVVQSLLYLLVLVGRQGSSTASRHADTHQLARLLSAPPPSDTRVASYGVAALLCAPGSRYASSGGLVTPAPWNPASVPGASVVAMPLLPQAPVVPSSPSAWIE